VTDRLRLTWPDPAPFAAVGGRPLRLLAISDEVDATLESPATRERLSPIDIVVGCGDLEPDYLSFVADAFGAPLHYVRGNHDVGAAWSATGRRHLPEALVDGRVVDEGGLRIVGFSGSPRYNERGMQRSAADMWFRVAWALPRARRASPLLVLTHAAPRDLNDGPDRPHRGFTAFRWLATRLRPPLWLHGHTALVRRGLDGRCARLDGTLFYNCTGASLVELLPPGETP
jgi:hypothetical protein